LGYPQRSDHFVEEAFGSRQRADEFARPDNVFELVRPHDECLDALGCGNEQKPIISHRRAPPIVLSERLHFCI
jgi:hypothetical protein